MPGLVRVVVLIVLLALLAWGCDRGTPPLAPGFDLQGHRGARGLFPENTLLGFRGALAIGVTTLEMDVGITQDGVAVVHHDEGLSAAIARGPSGGWLKQPTSLLRVLSWQKLQDIDVGRIKPGSIYAARFPRQQGSDGVRIPRLAYVLSEAEAISGGRIRYNIETKLDPDHPSWTASPVEFAEAIVAEIEAAGVGERTLIQSFDWRTLRHVAKHHPSIQTACLTTEQPGEDTVGRMQPGPSRWTAGLDVDDFEGSVPHLAQAAGCAVWSPFQGDLNPADMLLARELAVRVIPWTANEPEEIEAMLALGVDGIISDYPDRVREALNARGLPLPRRFGSRD